jgi:hypothetical protein
MGKKVMPKEKEGVSSGRAELCCKITQIHLKVFFTSTSETGAFGQNLIRKYRKSQEKQSFL